MELIIHENLCDGPRCGSRGVTAKVYFEFPDGREIQYCGHHADAYVDKLVLLGCDVLDTRQPIEAR